MNKINSFADLNLGWNKATLIKVVSLIGVGGITWIAKKVFDLGKIMQRLETVEKDIKDVKKDVRSGNKDLVKRIDDLMIAFAQANVSEAHSPRQLTNEGLRVLKDSGIDTIVDDKFDLIVKKVQALKPENAYQAERAIQDVIRDLAEEPAIKDAVEEGAFNSGSLAPVVLVVGAIYVRDRVLKELGLKPEEIDGHDPDQKK